MGRAETARAVLKVEIVSNQVDGGPGFGRDLSKSFVMERTSGAKDENDTPQLMKYYL